MRPAILALACTLVSLAACTTGEESSGAADRPALSVTPLMHEGRRWRGEGLDVPVTAATVLDARWHEFGGFSGLSLTDGHLTAVSDRGYWFRAALDGNGAVRPETAALGLLAGTDGTPLKDNVRRDAEALVAMPGGGWLVAFERARRIWYYPPASPPFSAAPRPVPLPADMVDGPYNGGPESMTLLPDGRLLVLEEGTDTPETGTTRGWLGTPGPTFPENTTPKDITWIAFRYRVSDGFRPTGAATARNGDILVLERFYSPLRGVAARLRRIPAARLQADAVVDAAPMLDLSAPAMAENYEGLAVMRDSTEGDSLTLISDDNYSSFQRTILLSLRP